MFLEADVEAALVVAGALAVVAAGLGSYGRGRVEPGADGAGWWAGPRLVCEYEEWSVIRG